MLTIHHLNESRSQRVIWLAEELGLPYRIEHHARNPGTKLAPESLKRAPKQQQALAAGVAQQLAQLGALFEIQGHAAIVTFP